MPHDPRRQPSDPPLQHGWAAFAPLAIGPVVVVAAAAATAHWLQRRTGAELAAVAALQQRLDRDQARPGRPLAAPLRWLTALGALMPDGVSLRRAENRPMELELEGDAATLDALETLRRQLQTAPWAAAVATVEVRSEAANTPLHRFVLRVDLGTADREISEYSE